MEVKYVTLIEPVGGHGGMDYYDYGLAYGLGKNKIKVGYYTCNETKKREFENVETLPVFEDVWRFPGIKKFFLYLKYHRQALISSKKTIQSVVHLHFFDLHVKELVVLVLAKLSGVKIIVTIHDVDSFHYAPLKVIEKIGYSLIDGVIVHNKSSYEELIKKKVKLPPVKIIPHGNYRLFTDQLPPPHTSNVVNLLFFGQIKEVKGLDILLRALCTVVKKNSDFRLTIAGRPWKTDKEKYVRLIADFGLENFVETHFRYIEDHEIKEFFQKADLVVLPYLRIYQSGVLLLAMSYGRAAITSDLNAFTEIITNGINGFTFRSGDAEDLAKCLLGLTAGKIKEVTLKATTSINGKYDWINIGKQTSEFYDRVVNR